MKEKRSKRETPPRGRRGRRTYPLEIRKKAIRLLKEEGFRLSLVAQELGIDSNTLWHWKKRYETQGEIGLIPRRGSGRSKLPVAVKERMVAVKRQNPSYGVRRIAHVLRRIFLLPGSHETVRRTLKAERLLGSKRRKIKRNPPKVRFFESSAPNKMWQSDIMRFQIKSGVYGYLIGFIDDHSRYITGLGVYLGQTAENVLEVYRRAVGEYGKPEELLTDNGRQYTNWRGKTAFEKELGRDRVHHFRSAPHHPKTLGKIERFWKTIHEEFLVRAEFATIESAQERIAYWVKYYNHKRPHQSLGGLCPADRYFSIREEMKAVIQKGIEENLQELALRGKPSEPLYFVGQVGGRSVIIQSEKTGVRMTVEDNGKMLTGGLEDAGRSKEDQETEKEIQRPDEGAERAVVMEREPEGIGTLPGNVDQLGSAFAVAGKGDGGYACVSGAEAAGGERNAIADGPVERTAGSQSHGTGNSDCPGAAERKTSGTGEGEGSGIIQERISHAGGESPEMGGKDNRGEERKDHGHGSGPGTVREPEDVLREGEPRPGGIGGSVAGSAGWAAGTGAGRREDGIAEKGEDPGRGKPSVTLQPADPGRDAGG
jgi:transposase InsO family protein